MSRRERVKLGRYDRRHRLPGYVGHYGCGRNGAARLVKVTAEKATERVGVGFRKPKDRWVVECPVCGEEHKVTIFWRAPKDEGEVGRAELVLA